MNVFKKLDKLHIFLALCFVFVVSVAAVPDGITRLTSLIIGSASDTPDVTPGDDDLYVKGTSEFDGAMRLDGAADFNSTLNVSGAVTLGTAGTITGTAVADVTRSIPLYLGAGVQDGGNDLDDGSTPTLTNADNLPVLQWDDSGEVTAAQWTFRVPPDYVQGGSAGMYALVSSDNATGTDIGLRWDWWVNNDNLGFDTTKITDNTAMCTSITLDASNEVLTMAASSTAIAAFTAGTWVTVDVYNANTTTNDNTELKGLEFYYTSAQ